MNPQSQKEDACATRPGLATACWCTLRTCPYSNLTRLFNQYRGSLACFSDDVQARPPSFFFAFFLGRAC